jgi:hypothetical protein
MLSFDRLNSDENQVSTLMQRYYMNVGSLQQARSLNPNIFRTMIIEQEEEHDEAVIKQDTRDNSSIDLLSANVISMHRKDSKGTVTPQSR